MVEDGVVIIAGESILAKKGDFVYLNQKQPAKINPSIYSKIKPIYKNLTCVTLSAGETAVLSVDIANPFYLDGWIHYNGTSEGYNYRIISSTQPLLIKGNTLECMGVIKGEPCVRIF